MFSMFSFYTALLKLDFTCPVCLFGTKVAACWCYGVVIYFYFFLWYNVYGIALCKLQKPNPVCTGVYWLNFLTSRLNDS